MPTYLIADEIKGRQHVVQKCSTFKTRKPSCR